MLETRLRRTLLRPPSWYFYYPHFTTLDKRVSQVKRPWVHHESGTRPSVTLSDITFTSLLHESKVTLVVENHGTKRTPPRGYE